mgnify:FL=1
MGRRIISPYTLEGMKGTGTGSTTTPVMRVDGYFDRVIKSIPGDIVAGWTAILGLFGATPGLVAGVATTNILWILWALLTVITFFWTYRQTRLPGAQPAWTQVFISTFAFVVWVLALGAPFNALPFYDTRLAAAILIVFTLAVGAVQPRE